MYPGGRRGLEVARAHGVRAVRVRIWPFPLLFAGHGRIRKVRKKDQNSEE